jgi:hypothetical protein
MKELMNSLVTNELHVGFTGPRAGITGLQKQSIRVSLQKMWNNNPNATKYFHHGDCIGADSVAHDVATSIGYIIVVHPPTDPRFRAFKDGIVLPEKSYLSRNRDIVDECHLVLAAIPTHSGQLRSGTWATIRYAKSKEKLWKIIKPRILSTGFDLGKGVLLK